MELYSTKNPQLRVSLKEAVFKGLPEDNGLYMPVEVPTLPPSFIANLEKYSFQEIAFTITQSLFQGAMPDQDIRELIENAITFPAPVVSLKDGKQYILELFHGPSLAFKDFGARFMAQLMSYFNQGEDQELVILVATSGDTGGAVASGFYRTAGIKVIILYPSGKVSDLQEKQLTTLGENVTALEIEGTFDDCQALVKKAFLDDQLRSKLRLSSANSINISRLVPQSFYYFEAYKQIKHLGKPVVFSVPSGNFGNLTAGLIAQKMGLPIHHFIAATNANDVVPEYLVSGEFTPRPSIATISNAMDVGNPSNFVRMLDIFGSTWNTMQQHVSGYAFDDNATRKAIKAVKKKFDYIIDPHGAVGYLALKVYQKNHQRSVGVILETAHPSKFIDVVEREIASEVAIPERLAILANKEKQSVNMPVDFAIFKEWLLNI